jgi:hypothetical protein
MQAFKQQLLQNPAVKSVSFSSDAPSSENNWGTNFYFDHSEKDPTFNTFLENMAMLITLKLMGYNLQQEKPMM